MWCAGSSHSSAANGQPPMVIAHRGGPAQMPENTMEAFGNARQLGVEMLEFDMNVTSDDRIVIHHDVKINPTICTPTGGSGVQAGPIRLMTLRDVRHFDCGSKRPPAYLEQKTAPGARIPTLDEFLRAFSGQEVLLLGETKMPASDAGYVLDPIQFVDRVEALIRKYGMEDRFILQSSDYRTIDAMHRKNPRIQRCLLTVRRFKPGYLEIARRHQATHLMLRTDDIDGAGIKQLRDAGFKIFSDVADSEAEWREYVRMGVDGILTNNPQGLIKHLEHTGIRRSSAP